MSVNDFDRIKEAIREHHLQMKIETEDLAKEISELSGAAVGISAFVLLIVLVLSVQLYFARDDVARLSRDLESFRSSLEKASSETQSLVASVPGVKKKKKARKLTDQIRVEIEAKERDTSGRTMIGAPPNL